MSPRMHAAAGGLAMALIATIWLATAVSELFGATADIVLVKTTIPWGFLLLIPALAAAGGSGFVLSRGRRGGVIDAKRRRMPIIALNGVAVLIPSALFLSWKAQSGSFDAAFYGVQVLELAAGALNLTLLGFNMRDGMRLRRPRRVA